MVASRKVSFRPLDPCLESFSVSNRRNHSDQSTRALLASSDEIQPREVFACASNAALWTSWMGGKDVSLSSAAFASVRRFSRKKIKKLSSFFSSVKPGDRKKSS